MKAKITLYEFYFKLINDPNKIREFQSLGKNEDGNEVYLHKEIKELKLVKVKSTVVPHYHSGIRFFCFLNDAELGLGGTNPVDRVGHIKYFPVEAGHVQAIGPYVLHSARHEKRDVKVELLIYTPACENGNEIIKPKEVLEE